MEIKLDLYVIMGIRGSEQPLLHVTMVPGPIALLSVKVMTFFSLAMHCHPSAVERFEAIKFIRSSIDRYMRQAKSFIKRSSKATWKQLSRWRRSSVFMHYKLRFVWKSKDSMCWPEME